MKRYIKDGVLATDTIVIDGCVACNPTEEMLVQAGYTEYQEPQKTIGEYKQEKLQAITAYDASDAVNSFTLGGIQMWIDFEERARIRQSIDAYRNVGKTEMTKWFNGRSFTYPLDTWQAMLDKLSVYASEALNVTEQHKAEVSALTTVEDVEAYDITKGYPAKLLF